MVKIISKNLDIKKLTVGTFLTDGAKSRRPRCEFYDLWDQNVNCKLFRGSFMQLSLYFFIRAISRVIPTRGGHPFGFRPKPSQPTS